MKYKKTKADLAKIITETPEFTHEQYEKEVEKEFPTVTIFESMDDKYIGKVVRSNIQVTSEYDSHYVMPTIIEAEKWATGEVKRNNKAQAGQKFKWEFDVSKAQDMLYLVDGNLNEDKIETFIKSKIFKVSKEEEHFKLSMKSKTTIFKCMVTDVFDNSSINSVRTEIMAYSLKEKLENGKKYRVTYRLVPDPHNGQTLKMIVLDVEHSADEISNFKVTEDVRETLKAIQLKDQSTLSEHLDLNVKQIQGLMNADINPQLIKFIEFWYHTPLYFKMNDERYRATIDGLIVGESRTGKSHTTVSARNRYKLGAIVDLPTTTGPGLIGGSNKVSGGYQTKSGVLPQNHKGAVVLEELGKMSGDIMKQLTAIRSSGVTRITRVSGTLELPTVLRMLSITNPKTINGISKPISSYPHGISVITDLIGSAEDIARFDLIAVFSDMATNKVKLVKAVYPKAYSEKEYETRIRWIWSRSEDQITISDEVLVFLEDTANTISEKYNSHIKLFGTETWMKILRIAIAIAGYVVSSDSTFTNIVVCKEHIEYAANFMISMYDNDTFRLAQYVEEENKRANIDEKGLTVLQQLFNQAPELLLFLEKSNTTTKNTLEAISGLDTKEYRELLKRMTAYSFIEITGYDTVPTERFRRGMKQINKNLPRDRGITFETTTG